MENQINQSLAAKVGLRPEQVKFLRDEFKKFGRNPMTAALEILAIENGYEEEIVKNLFDLHLAQTRKFDGLCEQKRAVYD